jgi:hypothetical protein
VVSEAAVLTTLAACTGVGAFVDFYIGKDGQKRVKDWLETWWYRLSDIPVRAVGREEALNALRVIDYLFGPKLFSWKRLRSACGFKLISLCVFPWLYFVIGLVRGLNIELIDLDMSQLVWEVIVICISFSICKGLIAITISILRENYFLNFVIAFILLMTQLLFFLYLGPLMSSVVSMTASTIIVGISDYFRTGSLNYAFTTVTFIAKMLYLELEHTHPWANGPIATLWKMLAIPVRAFIVGDDASTLEIHMEVSDTFDFLGLNLFRALLALGFFGSYLLLPVWPRILTLCARVIESDKPVFTVVGAGIGGFASAISALVK